MTDLLLVLVRMAVEPCRWFGEHVVIPNGLAIICGCVAGYIWYRLDN